MTLDFQNHKEAHGTEHALDQSNHDAGGHYTTRGDFCRVFYEQTGSLYRLSFLLTADQERAQQCFVSGLEDCAKGNSVFKEWARSWATRAIIQSAVRVIHPRPIEEPAPASFGPEDKMLAAEPPELAAVLLLDPFERFVYVMSVLEHYSDHDWVAPSVTWWQDESAHWCKPEVRWNRTLRLPNADRNSQP